MKKHLPPLLFLAVILSLAGCASKTGVHVWWNPFTWGTNRAATVGQIDAKVDKNAQKVTTEGQREVAKTVEALKFAPQDSRAVQVAQRTAANALSLLAISNGSLDLATQQADKDTIIQLLSDNLDLRARGEKAQAAAEGTQAKLSAENKQLLADKDEAVQKLAASYVEERKLANTVRNFWWIIGVVAGLWLLGNVISTAARYVPALAGPARLISGTLAPALAFAEHRATDGLQKLGHAISDARAKIPGEMEKVTAFIDDRLDTDHKKLVAAAANTAPRT